MRLFICDDDPVIGTLISLDLGIAGFDVAPQLYSWIEAAEALDRTRPDLLLLDLHMPSGSGLDLLDYLAKTGRHPGLAIVMLTSEHDGHYIERAKALGARGYLTKPIETGTLAAKLDRVLDDPGLRWIDDISALTEPGATSMRDGAFAESAAGRFLPWQAPIVSLTPTVAELTEVHGVRAIEGLLRSLVLQLDQIDLAGDADLEATAHAIRGAAASLGFSEAAEACGALETAVQTRRPWATEAHRARSACQATRLRIVERLGENAA